MPRRKNNVIATNHCLDCKIEIIEVVKLEQDLDTHAKNGAFKIHILIVMVQVMQLMVLMGLIISAGIQVIMMKSQHYGALRLIPQ